MNKKIQFFAILSLWMLSVNFSQAQTKLKKLGLTVSLPEGWVEKPGSDENKFYAYAGNSTTSIDIRLIGKAENEEASRKTLEIMQEYEINPEKSGMEKDEPANKNGIKAVYFYGVGNSTKLDNGDTVNSWWRTYLFAVDGVKYVLFAREYYLNNKTVGLADVKLIMETIK